MGHSANSSILMINGPSTQTIFIFKVISWTVSKNKTIRIIPISKKQAIGMHRVYRDVIFSVQYEWAIFWVLRI
jgi:hypothetical protein